MINTAGSRKNPNLISEKVFSGIQVNVTSEFGLSLIKIKEERVDIEIARILMPEEIFLQPLKNGNKPLRAKDIKGGIRTNKSRMFVSIINSLSPHHIYLIGINGFT